MRFTINMFVLFKGLYSLSKVSAIKEHFVGEVSIVMFQVNIINET